MRRTRERVKCASFAPRWSFNKKRQGNSKGKGKDSEYSKRSRPSQATGRFSFQDRQTTATTEPTLTIGRTERESDINGLISLLLLFLFFFSRKTCSPWLGTPTERRSSSVLRRNFEGEQRRVCLSVCLFVAAFKSSFQLITEQKNMLLTSAISRSLNGK